MCAISNLSIAAASEAQSGSGKLRVLARKTLVTRIGLQILADELESLSPIARLAMISNRRDARCVLSYLAYALPEREAVWWACMCLQHVTQPGAAEPDRRFIQAAQQWVRRPDEAARLAILPLMRESGGLSPASFVARAVLTSRLSQPDSVKAGLSVWHAVLGAADLTSEPAPDKDLQSAQWRASRVSELVARFRASALEIAHGGAGHIAQNGLGS